MANPRRRSSSLFPGLLLLFVGLLLLLHNYRGLDVVIVIGHWWPLILIFWGAVKLYERMAASRAGDPGAARITPGEVFLVLGLLSLLGMVVAIDYGRENIPRHFGDWGNSFEFDIEISPKSVPADARITIRNGHGDISVRPSDEAQIRISGKKNAKAWNENDAQKAADKVGVEIVQNGDGYEVRPAGSGASDSRISMDLDVAVPKKAALTIRNEKGAITVTDMTKPVNVTNGTGDVEVRGTGGDVTIDTRKGDIKVSDTKGNIKISGHGGEINVSGATGGLTVDGEFYGAIRADKVAKGVRFVSQRTDLTLSQLAGHMEASPGNLEIYDAPGNLSLRSQDNITLENASGRVKIDNRRGNVDVRFSFLPKEDIEITNASAGITLSLPESASFEIVADCHSGDIDSEFHAGSLKLTQGTGSGDSHLEGKYGSGRGPKIILKTSYGSISLRRTSSDIPAPPKPPRVKAPPAPGDSEEN
jgi:putative adhesin/cell wall-active antibiotic response 4TMS protein YvqF